MASGRGQDEGNVHTRVTLPPPEWSPPAQASPTEPEAPVSVEPLPRREGRKAEELGLRAILEGARQNRDRDAEAAAGAALARHLAAREQDLDEAVELALAALERRDDPELRKSVASWLEMLGESATAAMVLRKTQEQGAAAAATMLRVGTLLARAGDAHGASGALEDAAQLDREDATALELRGGLSSWAPDVVDARAAAKCYADAAARRRSAGALNAELEDALRAFEASPASEAAATALESALRERGRAAAAEHCARSHALSLEGPLSRRALVRMLGERLAAQNYLEALGLALDAGLDRAFSGEDAATFDGLLLRLGLLEPLAARLEVRAESATGGERTMLRDQLARLFGGPLGSASRAAVQHVRMLADDPNRNESLLALREYAAASKDRAPEIEGLVRGAASDRADPETAAGCARALAVVAEEKLDHPLLAAWAFERLRALAAKDSRVDAITTGLGGVDAALRRLGPKLPDDSERRAWKNALDAALEKETHNFGLGRWLLRQELAVPDEIEARASLASSARQRGDLEEASAVAAPLVADEAASARAASIAWVNAALASDARVRGRALEALAAFSAPSVRAVLLASASDAVCALAPAEAKSLAEGACQADPACARAIVALANACIADRDRASASVLERAVTAVFATRRYCEALAETLEQLGEHDYAVAWTQRLIALRPGDPAIVGRLLERVLRAGDPARASDVLSWLLPQPLPTATLAPLAARVLDALSALDPARAAIAARRALDALGPRYDVLADAVRRCAEAASDRPLEVALLTRKMGAGADAEARVRLLLGLAERQVQSDPDAALRSMARAVALGADASRVAQVAESVQGASSADAEIWRMEVRAAALEIEAARRSAPASRKSLVGRSERSAMDAAAAQAAKTLRTLGGLYWDMAGDARRAQETWLRAARTAPAGGYAALGVDLARFAGAQPALERLQGLVASEKDARRAGAIAAEAARASLAIGEPTRALELAEAALQRNPLVAGAIEIAERGALASGHVRDLSRVYDTLGTSARGRFGRRAAHYRGARFFEQRGEQDLALKHAAQAFAAVPSEGGTFFLLARIAERTGDVGYAVRTIEEVADASPSKGVRAGWLLRAASVAGSGEEGARMRVDVLLKAAFLQPLPSTLSLLGDAARDLLTRVPEERSLLNVRFAKASHALARKLEGPDGARVGIAFAQLEYELFEDAESAVESISRALESDADLEEYVLLLPIAAALAKAAAASQIVPKGLALLDKPFSNVGVPALRFLGALADALGDAISAGRFRMAAAERESDDDELLRQADLASRAVDPALRERFEKKVPAARRIRAHRAFAEAERLAGRYDKAIASLERVAELGPPETRAEIDALVRATFEMAGQAEELERRALARAKDEGSTPVARADAWTELAQMREQRGEVGDAARALAEAARLDPAPLERWSQLERVSALSGDSGLRAEALHEIEARVAPDARPAVLRRLAHAYEEAGDFADVEATWSRVLELRPDDEEADFAIEELLARQNDHVRLADHLAKRAERLARFPDRREMLRVVRLRRAAILEQRLGLLAQASEELKRLVAEWPNNESALRYLGDLLERLRDWASAVPVFKHLAALASDDAARSDLLVRAANAARASGDAAKADAIARSVLERNPAHGGALELIGDLAKADQDWGTVAQSLVALASSPSEDIDKRSDWLIEAAQAAARAGNAPAALEHAQKAAELAPTRAATQLFARGLEYRLRRAGTAAQAQETLTQLDLVREALGADDAALAAFLRAEALDVAQGGDAGLRYLERELADATAEPHALVEVALAERLAERWKFADALHHFKRALAGNMLGLRSPPAVAMQAADAAARAEQPTEAIELLELASTDETFREDALKRLAHVAATAGDLPRARAALEAALASPVRDRATLLASLGRLLFAFDGERDKAIETFHAAIDAAPADSVLRAQLEAELGTLSMRAQDGAPADEPSAPRLNPLENPASLGQMAAVVAEAPPGADRTSTRAALARAHIANNDMALGESLLLECLAEGDLESGDLLASLLERDPARTSDLLRVRHLQVEHVPGNVPLLTAMRNAALGDHNVTQARAIDHVLRCYDAGAGPLPPPPLSAQLEHPGMLQLLARPALDSIGEALALVWEGASAVLARDPQNYALTGVERVAPGPHAPIARLYEIAARLLGSSIPLYARRHQLASSPPPAAKSAPEVLRLTGGVALLPTLSAMVLGDVREDAPPLRYAMGQAFAATLPQCALLVGLPEAEGRVLWNAMFAAFGPPEFGKLSDPGATRLVQTFWNTIPPRAQRRLQELLAKVPTDFEGALERARQAGRRVGLFLCGDVGFVLRVVAGELGLPSALLNVEHFGELCDASPVVADLVRLAVSPDYADARWRLMPEGGMRATLSSGRYKVL